jgi:hypothetical protein
MGPAPLAALANADAEVPAGKPVGPGRSGTPLVGFVPFQRMRIRESTCAGFA